MTSPACRSISTLRGGRRPMTSPVLSSTGWVRTARSERTRTPSRSSAKRLPSTPKAISSTTPRSRALAPCPTSGSRRAPSSRPTSSARQTSSPFISSICSKASTPSTSPHPGQRCCSTVRIRQARSGVFCPEKPRLTSSRKTCSSGPSTRLRSPVTPAWEEGSTQSFRPASSISPVFYPRMTPSARSRSTFERPTATGGRRWSLATRTLSTGPLPRYFGSRWGQSPTAGRWPTLSRVSLPTS